MMDDAQRARELVTTIPTDEQGRYCYEDVVRIVIQARREELEAAQIADGWIEGKVIAQEIRAQAQEEA